MALSQQIKCESCDQMYPASKSKCPHCGAKRNATARRGGMTSNSSMFIGISFLVVMIVAVIVVVVLSMNKQAKENPPASPTSNIDEVTTSPSPTIDVISSPAVEVTAIVFGTAPADEIRFSVVGATHPLGRELFFEPEEAADVVTLSWESDDTSVAIVNPVDGTVEAVGEGTTKIRVKVGTYERECTVIVSSSEVGVNTASPAPGTSNAPSGTVKLSHTDVSLSLAAKPKLGTTFVLKANGTTEGVYYSSNTSVATVSESGEVKAIGKGYCKINVTYNGASADCEVRVVD